MRARDAAVLIILATAAHADSEAGTNSGAAPETEGLVSRWVEMPAHRALLRDLTEDPTIPLPFTTDGCSGGMSSMWQVAADTMPDLADVLGQHPPWEECCVIHDRAYHNIAGAMTPQDSFDARLTADLELRSCVIGSADLHADRLADYYDLSTDFVRAGFEQMAKAMFTSVRLGGGPCTALPWRWGFGYPNCIVSFRDLGSD